MLVHSRDRLRAGDGNQRYGRIKNAAPLYRGTSQLSIVSRYESVSEDEDGLAIVMGLLVMDMAPLASVMESLAMVMADVDQQIR